MAYDNFEQKPSAFSKIVRAGKRRTYFFDIKESKGNDYYLIITESRKRFDNNGYDKTKLFIYKEDFNKFTNTLQEVVNYAKTELMPNFNFDEFNHDNYNESRETANTEKEEVMNEAESLQQPEVATNTPEQKPSENVNGAHETVDTW